MSTSRSYNTLLTGASGFLGRHILAQFEGPVISIGRSNSNTIICDLSQKTPLINQSIGKVIHCAGKAHIIPKTAQEKQAFFQTNVIGSKNLLDGLETSAPTIKQFIFISTVAVYGLEEGEQVHEDMPLNGRTPYAQSKIQAEALIQAWCQKYQIPLLILRLPLIVGKNPPGNLGKMAQSIKKGVYFKIGNNRAHKSAVLADDVAQLIFRIQEQEGGFNLTDGIHPSFSEIENAIAHSLGKNSLPQLPVHLLKILAKGGDFIKKLGLSFPLYSERLEKMTNTLTFSDKKAREQLSWSPAPVTDFLASKEFGNSI